MNCLTPVPANLTGPAPVMVYVTGGGFIIGKYSLFRCDRVKVIVRPHHGLRHWRRIHHYDRVMVIILVMVLPPSWSTSLEKDSSLASITFPFVTGSWSWSWSLSWSWSCSRHGLHNLIRVHHWQVSLFHL